MKNIPVIIKGIIYRVIGLEWITASEDMTCSPVPVFTVEDDRVRVIHRGIRVVEDDE